MYINSTRPGQHETYQEARAEASMRTPEGKGILEYNTHTQNQ